MKTFNVGLIGYGFGGQAFHAPFINAVEGLQLTLIRETKADRTHLINERYPSVRIVSASEDVFMDEEIDLVVISVPNTFHFSLVQGALMAGKHVVVDKPFTLTTGEAQKLMKLAQKVGKKLSVFQNRRWDSDFQTVQEIVASEILGRLHEVEINFDRFSPDIDHHSWKEEPKIGHGIEYDIGSHLIDQALVLFGEPNEVFGDIRIQRENGQSPDYMEVIFYYDYLKVTLRARTLVKAPVPHFVLHGDHGSFVKYGMDVQEENLKKGRFPKNDPYWGIEPKTRWGTLYIDGKSSQKLESEKGDYGIFYENLYQALQNDRPMLVTPMEAYNVIKAVELARQSNEERRVIGFNRSFSN